MIGKPPANISILQKEHFSSKLSALSKEKRRQGQSVKENSTTNNHLKLSANNCN